METEWEGGGRIGDIRNCRVYAVIFVIRPTYFSDREMTSEFVHGTNVHSDMSSENSVGVLFSQNGRCCKYIRMLPRHFITRLASFSLFFLFFYKCTCARGYFRRP